MWRHYGIEAERRLFQLLVEDDALVLATEAPELPVVDRPASAGSAAAAAVALLLALSVAAGPALEFCGVAARQLLNRAAYVAAVAAAR